MCRYAYVSHGTFHVQHTKKQKIGVVGEDVAARFLISQGYRILARNVRKGNFEVDIIAERAKSKSIFEIKCVAREKIAKEEISREMFVASTGYDYRKEKNIHLAAESLGISSVYLVCVALSLQDARAYVALYQG